MQETERELSTAYTEVATLQQQLGERDEDVHQLQQRMCNETQQWVSVAQQSGAQRSTAPSSVCGEHAHASTWVCG